MDRYLCLDIGDKRIGVAVSDPFNTYALPVETYHRKTLKTDLEKIVGYIKQKGATTLVCGLPVNFDGTPSIQTNKAKFFIDRLVEIVPVKVVTVDERCSTVEAEEILIKQNKSREERKSVIDSLAATTILNGYLSDINKNKKN
ncbi:MAG: Holliday junction resolvase RuvX [Clostridia bacterium]|nr:Holliday junction resolvase RuvX [Clostridia bacterium]